MTTHLPPSLTGKQNCQIEYPLPDYEISIQTTQQHQDSHRRNLNDNPNMITTTAKLDTGDDIKTKKQDNLSLGPNRQVQNLLLILLRVLRERSSSDRDGKICVDDTRRIAKDTHFLIFHDLFTRLLPEMKLSHFGNSFEERLVFLINLHNLCAVHHSIVHGARHRLFCSSQVRYNVGGHLITTQFLEGVIRGTQQDLRHPFLTSINWTSFYLKKEPRRHFAIYNGDMDCAPLEIYNTQDLTDQLEHAKEDCMRKIQIETSKQRICIPRSVESYLVEVRQSQKDIDIKVIINRDLNHSGIRLQSMITSDYKVVVVSTSTTTSRIVLRTEGDETRGGDS